MKPVEKDLAPGQNPGPESIITKDNRTITHRLINRKGKKWE